MVTGLQREIHFLECDMFASGNNGDWFTT